MKLFALALVAATVFFSVRSAVAATAENRRRNLCGAIGTYVITALSTALFISLIFMDKII